MRLIDADALAEKIREKMNNGFPANENLSIYAISCLSHAPTVDVLEQIRAEISEYKDDKVIHAEVNEMIDIVLEIIDKYKGDKE